ncbi:uncharacterized protein BX664DRAFT_266256 [Halteromyces radiatus]|uniref:uncharacterized protein n=1 Tax=Halteromyces radiatus TaxID=101107 RepID=UPI0022205B29|nr:uncharacterized protein BX664DRAFT_266256 [Halteromyces radiatus]KAI8084949.1 hypothetical protein BX664DRAFT_266256 [Halteromyces radiatus]
MLENKDHDSTTTKKTRLPRHEYRKHIKLIKRRQKRQTLAANRHAAEEKRCQEKDEQEKQHYLEQKAQWEERERNYTLINMARKRVMETEKRARQLAMDKWHASLRELPIPKPPGYSSSTSIKDSPTQLFVLSSTSQSSTTDRRRTYRDKFEQSKKSK